MQAMNREMTTEIDIHQRWCDFDHPADILAEKLLGKVIVRSTANAVIAGRIVEVEAYLGHHDAASHSFGGRKTPRNASMFLSAGSAYVYLIYGVHHCLNVVCGAAGQGTAVLIRALEPVAGVESMRANRPQCTKTVDLCRGPGRLCRALAIDRTFDGIDLASDNRLFVVAGCDGRSGNTWPMVRTKRIGVEYAGRWANAPLRFLYKGHPCVSGPRIQ